MLFFACGLLLLLLLGPPVGPCSFPSLKFLLLPLVFLLSPFCSINQTREKSSYCSVRPDHTFENFSRAPCLFVLMGKRGSLEKEGDLWLGASAATGRECRGRPESTRGQEVTVRACWRRSPVDGGVPLKANSACLLLQTTATACSGACPRTGKARRKTVGF